MARTSVDCVSKSSLAWAKAHIKKYNDTDIFPPLFEFDAISANWESASLLLQGRNLSKFTARSQRRLLVPKPGFGFRAATQLDPLDALMYSALVREHGVVIEADRIPKDRRVACSFRIDPQPNGLLLRDRDGWSDFHEASSEHCAGAKFVVTADISDFYNQASHHRIENALETATIATVRAKNIERVLGQFTAKTSRGLPVGPTASIVFAEACLNDVDKYLISRGLVHTRYVDDFRIFSKTERDAVASLHLLTEYLHTAHRLSLQSSKTKIWPVKSFRKAELLRPEDIEEDGKARQLEQLVKELIELTGYSFDDIESFEDLPEDNRNKLIRDNIKELFEEVVNTRPIPLGMSRYLLRRARVLRSRAIYKTLFANLSHFAPVFRDVAFYLRRTMNERMASKYGPLLLSFLRDDPWGGLPFIRHWGLWLMQEIPTLASFAEAKEIAEQSRPELGMRPIALLARAHNEVPWVRALKETWMSEGPWDRRAILWAGSILPRDERMPWLGGIADGDTGDPLESWVAQLAKTDNK